MVFERLDERSVAVRTYPCAMSSRIESPFGALGDRIASTRGELPGPPRRPGGPRHPHGLHVDVLDDQARWVPGLLVAWEHDAAGTWWGRVVTVTDATATESLYTARRLRPAHHTTGPRNQPFGGESAGEAGVGG